MSDMKETDLPPLEPQPFVTEEGREIERLRDELAAECATTASLLRIIALIREAGGLAREDLDALPGAVKAMRQQRDEARREVCELRYTPSEDNNNVWYAGMRGWDCYGKGVARE